MSVNFEYFHSLVDENSEMHENIGKNTKFSLFLEKLNKPAVILPGCFYVKRCIFYGLSSGPIILVGALFFYLQKMKIHGKFHIIFLRKIILLTLFFPKERFCGVPKYRNR